MCVQSMKDENDDEEMKDNQLLTYLTLSLALPKPSPVTIKGPSGAEAFEVERLEDGGSRSKAKKGSIKADPRLYKALE